MIVALVVALPTVFGAASAQDRLAVVTTLPDLKSIVEAVGGDRVDAFSIATGFQNPHFVDPKPSYIRRLSRADVFVTVGLDLEIGWVQPLLSSARNPKVAPGGQGYVDASVGIPLLQMPTSLSREQGDIHVYGNPHYWLDPVRGKIVAATIADALSRISPRNEDQFRSNLREFVQAVDAELARWQATLAPYKGARVIAYHNEWPYFEDRFGIEIAGFLEPKPGIPPTPSQLASTIRQMEREGIRVIITSPYFKADAADLVARRTGAVVVTLATSVGAREGIESYFDLFDYNVSALAAALRETGYPVAPSD